MTTSKRLLIGRVPITALLLVLLFAGQTWAQAGGVITGTVTDADTKEALPASTVQIPKIKAGAKTDANGNFKITKLPPGTYTVEAKLIGYKTVTKSVTVGENETVTANFVLSAQALRQNEIVVTGLSGEVDRRKLGNAVGSVDGAEVAKATTATAIDAISGRVPGVQVTRNSGTPGAGTYVTIRGRKTISGSSEPLYVVDGVLIDNTMITDQNFQSGEVQLANRAIDINPADIESMEILKGAAAAALYGSLAANGVVLITTKKGTPKSDGMASVYFSTALQTDESPKSYPLQTIYGQLPGTNLSYGPKLPAGTPTYDQSQVPFRSGLTMENTLNVGGGAADYNYLLSGTWTSNEGIVKGSELERRNLRLNLRGVILKNLDIQTNNNYISINNDLPQDGSNTSGNMLGALRTPPEFDNSIVYNPDGTQHRFAAYDNPLWSQENNKFNTTVGRFIHSTTANWDPLDWLRVSGRIGYDGYGQENIERMAVGSANSGRIGSIEHTIAKSSSVNTDLSATATFTPMEELELSVVAGGQTIWVDYEMNVLSSNQTLEAFDEITAGANKDARSELTQSKLVGMFGQVTGTLWDKLSLTLGVRRDGSSTFSQFDKFHNYPKASFSYELSKEEFMKDLEDIFSSVKIRGSYGEAGSPSLPGAYTTNNLYTTFGNNDGWGRVTTAGRGELTGIRQGFGTDQTLFFAGATHISPEISIEREIGLDMGLFDNRVNLEFTYYYTNVNDLILEVPAPGSSGYDRQFRNAGAMRNKGFEVSLGAWPVRSEDFSWNTIVNYSTNDNLVTRLLTKEGDNIYGTDDQIPIYGFTGTQNVALVGHPIGVFSGLGYLRNADGSIKVSTGAADDAFGNDYRGAPIILFDSAQIIGDPNPDFTFSWRNDITFLKNFNVSFLVDAVMGQDIWNGTKGALYRFGTHADTKDREEPWFYNGQPVIDNATGEQVKKEEFYRLYANSFQYGIDEASIEDGSYIKLREVSISYKWDGLKDIGIAAITFTASGRNLLTITDYTGFDPEVNTFAQSEARGFDYFNLPQTRSYRFGISLNY